MKLATKFFLFVFILSFNTHADKLKDAVNYQPFDSNSFITKFGLLTMLNERGERDSSAVDIKLGDKLIYSVRGEKNIWGSDQFLMHPLYDSGLQVANKIKSGNDLFELKRMILMIGPDGNCVNQTIIFDLTGSSPYISDKFGYNPDGKSCLEFVKAKWGKKESYIYLKGPLKYVYYTGGKVIGPLE